MYVYLSFILWLIMHKCTYELYIICGEPSVMHKAVELVAFHLRRLLVDCRLLLSKKIGKEKIGSLYSLCLECAGIPAYMYKIFYPTLAAMAMVNLMSTQAVNIARA